ncbi:S-adenosyl-L-methionine-dependent methyltransferase [Mycena leptocephala]|nr:S-adenosyl-L-methionine-dependent methyltransferase [Mycena leptocephala]
MHSCRIQASFLQLCRTRLTIRVSSVYALFNSLTNTIPRIFRVSMLSNSGLADIVALADLISSAVKDVVAEYTSAQVSMPSLSSTSMGPFDIPESMPSNLIKAIRTVEAACTQLTFSVANPGLVVCQKAYGFQEPVCMLVATDSKIADHLLDKPKDFTVLRLLATKHCFTEVKPNVFANNRLSMKLVSTDPVSGVVGHMTDEVGLACTALNETLKDSETTASLSTQASAFNRAHGCSIFDFYLAFPDQKKRADRFAQAMVGMGQVTGKGMLPKVYPWASLPQDTVFCDVGGNNGHVSISLLKAFPQLKIVFMQKENLNPTLKERVQFVPLDFFSGTPVKDCDIYYLRHVLHDWPVDNCKMILDNIRKAVKSTSRVFIHEMVLQHLVNDGISDNQFETAPEPLLPNFGAGRFMLYAQDINMMCLLNSQERALPQFIDIGVRSGFEFFVPSASAST